MTHTRRPLTGRQSQLFRSLIATAFIANGFFPFVAPALAEGTKAGQTISNTATATYQDPNNSGTTLNTTSNPVVVTVAEVAGITISNVGVVDSTPADVIKVGDTLTYTFAIKNVGNDPTRFRIPNLATTTGPVVAGNLSYSINGSYTQIPGTEVITSSIPVGGTVLVQVPVTVQAGASDPINVKIGDTPNNTQNVLRVNNGGDVYTVDNPDAPTIIDEIPGVPINGTREASNTQISTVGSTLAPNNMSLATLLKTNTYSNNNTTNSITDDTITYNLSLRVEGSDVTGRGITPQPLTGYTGISVDGVTTKNYILVSDVIPAGTVLSAVPTAPAAPSGWRAVYSTAPASGVKPQDVVWTTTAPATAADLGTVTRVGFVKETPASADNIAAGATITGFAIPLAITGTPTTLTISNIAQLVGQTPQTPGAGGLPVGGLPVYDESGDQNPSNYSGPAGNMTPGAASTDGILPTDAAAVLANIIDGVANPITQGIDTNNNNTGTGPGGEDNQLIISVVTTPTTGVLNGPVGTPGATGPDGTNNTDFTNKSSFIPAGTSAGSTIDPAPVNFSNTVQNDTAAAANVTLAPTVPANKFDLPTGTKVTITRGSDSAVYTYNQAGSGSFTIASGGTTISILNVPANGIIGYGVEVDLPAGTKLSTDTLPDYTGDTEWGYPVPITATIGSATNITIDRVYTGFLQLLKFSRILQGTGPDVIGNQGNFNSTPAYTNPATGLVIDPDPAAADEARTPSPGNIIVYEIRYKNISTSQTGSGTGTSNVILQAQNVVITEDGTLSTVPGDGKNNWAKDNDNDGIIDTSNVIGTATATTTTFTPNGDISGATPATDVTKYVNSPTTSIAPQTSGTFTFQRKLN
jgi:hypothetical protein